MVWNVYVGDFNGRKIKEHNVFDHWGFWTDCVENAKKNKADKEAFFDRLRKDLMYYYWSKCEWEVVVSHWPPIDGAEIKVDVYDQVMLNWSLFSEYVWENRGEFKKKAG